MLSDSLEEMNMQKTLENAWYSEILVCPDCGNTLAVSDEIKCDYCQFHDESGLDLRAQQPNPLKIEHHRVPTKHATSILKKVNLFRPSISYKGPNAARDSREFMSVIVDQLKPHSKILDLGCGPRDQSIPVNHLNHQYVGVDFTNPAADFLADAHSIPFQDNSFDCVLSYAVLEHLHDPYIAIREIHRVLKPDGIYVGSVSQGEPYHQSYFHMTPWGFLSLICAIPTFQAERLWGSMDTIEAISRIGRYPLVIRRILTAVDKVHKKLPFLSPRKMKWPEKEKKLDELYRAGSLCFVIKKQNIA